MTRVVEVGCSTPGQFYTYFCIMEELSNKKVKFAYEPEENGEENDLDLDTIRASKNKPKGLKEFDSEGSEEEEEEEQEPDMEEESDKEEIEEDQISENDSIDERQVPLIPFNLREDREEGNFDSEGFYTRKQDEEADQDRWMANFTLTDIVKARKAHEERKKSNNSKEQKIKNSGKSEKQLWEELEGLLVENDLTVLETIRQITPKQETQKQSAPLNKNRLKKLQKEQQQQHEHEQRKQDQNTLMNLEGKEKMERITELADALMDFGNFGVYEETRRGILRKLNK